MRMVELRRQLGYTLRAVADEGRVGVSDVGPYLADEGLAKRKDADEFMKAENGGGGADMPETRLQEPLSIDEIMASFAGADSRYKRAEVDAAIARREEITARLLEVLEAVVANPQKVAEDTNDFAHIYAIMLLGHFREAKAHPAIIALCRLGEDLSYLLFGDIITADMPAILLRTCNGSFEAIKGLVEDRAADDDCRGAAATALTYGVAEGTLPRQEALAFLGGRLDVAVAEKEEGVFNDLVASCICHLCPEEVMDRVEAAFAEELIDPGFIGLDDFKQILARGKERCLLDLKSELEERSLEDLHERMAWWGCFHESPRQPTSSGPSDGKASKSKAKKDKRKLAKASRRKNRAKRR